MARHGIYPKDIVPPISDYFASGRFGRLFGKLPPFSSDTPAVRHALMEIGEAGGIMDAMDDPFAALDRLLAAHPLGTVDAILVDWEGAGVAGAAGAAGPAFFANAAARHSLGARAGGLAVGPLPQSPPGPARRRRRLERTGRQGPAALRSRPFLG